MPTANDLLTEVHGLTKRPDLVTSSTLQLKLAIKALHNRGKLWRDLVVETNVIPSLAAYDTTLQLIDLSTAPFARVRQVILVQNVDGTRIYNNVTPDDILTSDNVYRSDIWYGVGKYLAVRPAELQNFYKLTYYQYPDLSFFTSGANSTSWLYEHYQELVTMLAASNLLASIGERELKPVIDAQLVPLLADFDQNNVEAVGR